MHKRQPSALAFPPDIPPASPAIELGIQRWAELRDKPLVSRFGGKSTSTPQPPLLSPAAEIQLGLQQGEFRAYLQPKVTLPDGRVDTVEVLARWHHPARGVIGPQHFIALMSRHRLLDGLLFELLEQCLAHQLARHAQGHTLGLAFNVSLDQLMNNQLLERLEARLRRHPLPASTLTFEITEDGPPIVPAQCVDNLARLSRLGVRLSLDDFGTGHSSLLRLCQLPFSEIKLAGEFTGDLQRYPIIAQHALALATDLGMQLVVEGIETQVQHERLCEMGIQIGQGFLYARPMPIELFDDWMQKRHRCKAAMAI